MYSTVQNNQVWVRTYLLCTPLARPKAEQGCIFIFKMEATFLCKGCYYILYLQYWLLYVLTYTNLVQFILSVYFTTCIEHTNSANWKPLFYAKAVTPIYTFTIGHYMY